MTTEDPNFGMNARTNMPTTSDGYTSMPGSRYDAASTDPTSASQSTGDQLKETAGQVINQTQQTVGQVTDQARQQATSQLATRKDQAATNLTDVSQAVSQVGSQLRQNDHDTLAQYADMAAQQVNRVASYLRERNINEMFDEVQGLARRQPALFLAGAFALGMLGARFLRSSTPHTGSANQVGVNSQYSNMGTYHQHNGNER